MGTLEPGKPAGRKLVTRTRKVHNERTAFTVGFLPGWSVELTYHFRKRKQERDVRNKEIRDTLAEPDWNEKAHGDDEVRIVRKVDHRNFVHIIGIKDEKRKALILKTVMVLPTGKMMRDEP